MASAFALAIFSGIGFLFGIQKSLRAFLNPLFTSRVVTENGILQRRFLRKRGAVGGVLALSGAYAPALPKGEPLAKLHTLQLNRKLFLRTAKSSPFGGAGKTVRF